MLFRNPASRLPTFGTAGVPPALDGQDGTRRLQEGDRDGRDPGQPQLHQGSGSVERPADCSMTSPSENKVSSSNGRPITCKPSGSPSAESPAGATRPGRPAMFTVTVKTS